MRRHKSEKVWERQLFLKPPDSGIVAASGYVNIEKSSVGKSYVNGALRFANDGEPLYICDDVDAVEELSLVLQQYARALRRARKLLKEDE